MTEIYNRSHLKDRRRELRRDMPEPERRLWLHLKNRQLQNLKFRRQFGIGAYVLDFYCPDLKLAVEVDGDSHGSSGAKHSDDRRSKFLTSLGIRIIRYTNQEVMQQMNAVLQHLSTHTSPPPSLPRRGNRLNPGRLGLSPLLGKEGSGEV